MIAKKLYAGFSVLALSALLMTGCGDSALANKVHSVADLQGKKIGVQTDTTGDAYAGDIENATVERYQKAEDGIKALQQGVVDAVIVDMETAKLFVEQYQDVEILGENFLDEEYAIAMPLGSMTLKEEIDSALKALRVNGTMQKIKSNYEGDERGQHPYEINDQVDRSKGKLVMATNAEFPPFEYTEEGNIVGFDVDMANAVCDYLGYELQIVDMAFDSVIPAVMGGQADIAVAALSVTEERQQQVLFSDAYETTHQVIVVRK
jgi:polar amino acid transport system substrate-binding protein